MLYSVLVVGLGGALGVASRFIISRLFISSSSVFTYVVLVNIIGCLVAGMVAGYVEKHTQSEILKLFVITGILGGFTTFSAFSLDVLSFLNRGKSAEAVIYILISVIGSILAAVLGYYLTSKV